MTKTRFRAGVTCTLASLANVACVAFKALLRSGVLAFELHGTFDRLMANNYSLHPHVSPPVSLPKTLLPIYMYVSSPLPKIMMARTHPYSRDLKSCGHAEAAISLKPQFPFLHYKTLYRKVVRL
jgi:hypothetical protein